MKNTEMKDKFEQATADEPIVITGDLEDAAISESPTASMQWIESITNYYYDEKGNISSSSTTTFHVPDKPVYEIFPPLMAIDPEDCCCMNCEEAIGSGAQCAPDRGEEHHPAKEEDPDDDNVRYCLSPKGIALMAAIDAGFVKDIDDENFELFWKLFHDRMIADGYAEEDEEEDL